MKLTSLSTLFLAATMAPSVQGQGTECSTYYDADQPSAGMFYGSYYKAFTWEDVSIEEAYNAARGMSLCNVQGNLVSIRDQDENDKVSALLGTCPGIGIDPNPQAWIGLTDNGLFGTSEGNFGWSTGEPFDASSFENWCNDGLCGVDQPNGGVSTLCLFPGFCLCNVPDQDFVAMVFEAGAPGPAGNGCWRDYNGYGTILKVVDHYIVEFQNVPCDCPMLASNQCPDPCENSPCENGGVCAATGSPGGYTCDCEGTGFVGSNCEMVEPGAMTDPHFLTWSGEWYDFMGACDLHLIQAPALDLTIDIRTKIRYEYSFIESAAVRIGADVLEVGSFGIYSLNGVENTRLPKTMGVDKHPVSYKKIDKKRSEFTIGLDQGEKIVISTMKDMVSVKILNSNTGRFNDSAGMMGQYGSGKLFGRDGVTIIEDPNKLAAEWQVRDTETMIFQSLGEGVHFPEACMMPIAVEETSRRLGETVERATAETACAKHTHKAAFEACVHDVIATGDLEMADAGAF